MKYPKESLPKKPSKHIADKKYGFFQSEKTMFQDVAQDLGLSRRSKTDLSFQRHPLAFLVEAADDICYTIIDFEDGINLGLIQEEYALEYGVDEVEIHADAIPEGAKVLLVDDLIATGGTAIAGAKLIERAGGSVPAAAFAIDLPDLGGAKALRERGITVFSVMEFEGD